MMSIEINDSKKAGWIKTIEVVEGKENRQMSLFPEDREIPEGVENSLKLIMNRLELSRPTRWGAFTDIGMITMLWEIF